MTDWRSPSERDELVERLIRAETECQTLHRILRDWAEQVSERSDASYVVALHARIAVLEENQKRLLAQRHQAA